MYTVNEIEIRGAPDRIIPLIFRLAADIQDWPTLLPHYRYMKIIEKSETRKLADYGASRDGFPVKWRAIQELFPEENRITFKHVGGITRGMWVEWRLETREQSVHVTISHELAYPVPVLGPLFAKYIVGRLFVENIAGKTLRRFKAIVESSVQEAAG